MEISVICIAVLGMTALAICFYFKYESEKQKKAQILQLRVLNKQDKLEGTTYSGVPSAIETNIN